MQHIQLIARYFKQEIIVNEVTDESVFVLCGQLNPEEEEEEEEEEKYLPMTIGIHKEPPSFITDLERQLKYMIYECAHCGARFTQSCKLLYHATRCTNGQTKIVCRGEKIWAPESLYGRTFHTKGKYGKSACYWIEIGARRHGIHISYQMCWHRDERLIAGHPVDGFHLESKTIHQFHGCHFHGCPQCYLERDHVLHRMKGKNVTREHV